MFELARANGLQTVRLRAETTSLIARRRVGRRAVGFCNKLSSGVYTTSVLPARVLCPPRFTDGRPSQIPPLSPTRISSTFHILIDRSPADDDNRETDWRHADSGDKRARLFSGACIYVTEASAAAPWTASGHVTTCVTTSQRKKNVRRTICAIAELAWRHCVYEYYYKPGMSPLRATSSPRCPRLVE